MEFWSSLGISRLPIRRAVCGKRKCQSWVAGYSICVCWLHACSQIVAPCVLGWCSCFFCKEEVWLQCCCIWPRIWSTCWKTRDDGFLIFSGVCVCSPAGPSDHIVLYKFSAWPGWLSSHVWSWLLGVWPSWGLIALAGAHRIWEPQCDRN